MIGLELGAHGGSTQLELALCAEQRALGFAQGAANLIDDLGRAGCGAHGARAASQLGRCADALNSSELRRWAGGSRWRTGRRAQGRRGQWRQPSSDGRVGARAWGRAQAAPLWRLAQRRACWHYRSSDVRMTSVATMGLSGFSSLWPG